MYGERRWKVAYLGDDFLLGLFWEASSLQPGDVRSVYRLPQVPDGTQVVRVFYDAGKQATCVVLEHADWPHVMTGEEIPCLGTELSTSRLVFRQMPDGTYKLLMEDDD